MTAELACTRCRQYTPPGAAVQYGAGASVSGREERLCYVCMAAEEAERGRGVKKTPARAEGFRGV